MASKTHAIQFVGGDAVVVDIECHFAAGLPAIQVVGMTNKSVDESKERLRAAFASSNIGFPKKKITINLAPADIQKMGAGFDVAIAASLLLAMHAEATSASFSSTAFFGELGLDGSVRPVRGIIGKLLAAADKNLSTVVIPTANLEQALLVPQIRIFAIGSLTELLSFMNDPSSLPVIETNDGIYEAPDDSNEGPDMSDVIGQERAKRALCIAAAGGHNILLNGPPGMGKSMLAKTLPGILPPLTHSEALQITHLHSLGASDPAKAIYSRPFRSPHHSASDVSVIGGGQNPKPGEITMAHGGVLFLDELPEFKRATIEALRQPLEDGIVTVSRAKETVRYPAQFMLVATRNPCPCGYFGSERECSCTAAELHAYNKKLSGPIMDRIDIHVTVDPVDHKDLMKSSTSRSSATIQKLVEGARLFQIQRYGQEPNTNSTVSTNQLKKHSQLSKLAEDLLNTAAERLKLSPRVYMKTVRLARTIADLDESVTIEPQHVSEALQYRPVASKL